VPSHTPVVPQLVGSWVAQRSPGSVPGSAGKQVPSLPGFLHVKQASAQAVSQQTPSTHCPEPHSVAVAQGSPGCFAGLSGIPVSPIVIMSAGASVPAST
jgi:hypothetical protein